jgi:hypothetical protein
MEAVQKVVAHSLEIRKQFKLENSMGLVIGQVHTDCGLKVACRTIRKWYNEFQVRDAGQGYRSSRT